MRRGAIFLLFRIEHKGRKFPVIPIPLVLLEEAMWAGAILLWIALRLSSRLRERFPEGSDSLDLLLFPSVIIRELRRSGPLSFLDLELPGEKIRIKATLI